VREKRGQVTLVRTALEKLDAGKPVEALHLTDVVLAYDQNNSGALNARLKALGVLRDRCENYVEAGWLEYGITKAKEKLGSQ
jgi:hypothetical protein